MEFFYKRRDVEFSIDPHIQEEQQVGSPRRKLDPIIVEWSQSMCEADTCHRGLKGNVRADVVPMRVGLKVEPADVFAGAEYLPSIDNGNFGPLGEGAHELVGGGGANRMQTFR